ncbi:hypothetical protein [uncultured Deinococcus sp.]|uniref:hypothetical protein n=1 Tax=uncultured Deinococcus sp. TaxID=158789 RepID=UPI0025CE7E10|nr:hypothetical protein [uncultured Deinococcus sp.]
MRFQVTRWPPRPGLIALLGLTCAGAGVLWSVGTHEPPCRQVTLYSTSGAVMPTWQTTPPIEAVSGGLRFRVAGERVSVRGTLTSEPCGGRP